MSIVTLDELARGACIGVFGGLAGVCTLTWPGSPVWLLPAGMAVAGCAATYPEVRAEIARQLPALAEPAARVRAALPTRAPRGAPGRLPPRGQAGTPHASAPASGHAGEAPTDLLGLLGRPPHRLVIGHTGGGKTTLLHALATGWAAEGQRVLVADPDAAPGQWPGCEVAGGGDDMPAIAALFDEVRAEIAARRAARAQGERRAFPPLHLVMDEAQDVLSGAGGHDLFEDIARRGRKINVYLTVGVQDRLVKTLGLEGKSDLRQNLEEVRVLRTAGGRVAVLRHPETGEREQYAVPDLPDPEQFIRRPTPPPPPAHPPPAAPDQLAAALAAVPAISPERAARLARILAAADTGTPASQRQGTGIGTGTGIERSTSTSTAADTGTTASQRQGTGITIEPAEGSGVTVNVNQHVITQPGRGARRSGRMRGPRGRMPAPAMRGRRARMQRTAAIRALVDQGLSANAIYERVGGSRAEVLAIVKQHRGGGPVRGGRG